MIDLKLEKVYILYNNIYILEFLTIFFRAVSSKNYTHSSIKIY